MKLPFRQRQNRADASLANARLLLGIAFALIVVAAGAAVYMATRAVVADRLVAASFDLRQLATDLLSELQDAETGQRGYLLTLDPAYLDPFTKAEEALPATLTALDKATAGDAGQSDRVRALLPLLSEKRQELRDTIRLAQSGDQTSALAIVNSDRGRTIMDAIRGQVAAILSRESQQLGQRQQDASAARRLLLALIFASLTLAVALALFLASAANRAIRLERQRTVELETEAALRRQTEETLRQSQKIEAIGLLTGGIAHDFNNLLTIIIGNLDTLRRRLAGRTPGDDAERVLTALVRPIELALQGARSAASLTHRLLAFSRRQPLDPRSVDTNRLISGTSDLLSRTLGENIHVETVLAAGLWPTLADANQLENALINLCVNARDAMPNGGKLTIETANTYLDEAYVRRFGDVEAGQYVLLSVSDTGTGMSPDVLAHAFEPFFTTKPTGEGSGLGLATVHGFAKQSRGHVRIYSEPGLGTTVKLYLPRLPQEEATAAPAPRAEPATASLRSRGAEVVLLVEDNDGVRQFASDTLKELGYSVVDVPTAEAALEVFGRKPDITMLLTDVVLPGMTGRQLADRVCAARPTLKVLFTTGYTRNAIIHDGRLDPGVQLLTKPFAQHELASRVREILDGGPPPA